MLKKRGYAPGWKGAIEGHAINQIRSFFPRLQMDYDFDDLLQEAHIVFIRCQRKYAGVVNNEAWYMTIFSRALRNRLINLLPKKDRPAQSMYISIEDVHEAEQPRSMDEGFLRCVLRELPSEVQDLLKILISGQRASGPLRRRGTALQKDEKEAYRKLQQMYPRAFGLTD